MSILDQHLQLQLEAIWKEALQREFSCFFQQSFQTLNSGSQFEDNWHLDAISEYLRAVEQQQVKRLIINMPPRYLKSLAVSVAWPAWLLGQDPARRILVASYAQSLSLKHSLDSRDLLQAPWFRAVYPHAAIMDGQNEKHKFMTKAHGFRLAVSVGGAVTGEGGDILIVDDPLNPQQAESQPFRNLANRWFEHTFSSRLNDKRSGAMVVVMQRLHPDDLSGFLLRKGGWELLQLPAYAPENRYFFVNDWVHRVCRGAVLHPLRENEEILGRLKHEMGSYAFAAQYMQQPAAREGGLVKSAWLQRYDSALSFRKNDAREQGNVAAQPAFTILQTWDTAIKAGAANDPSVCLTLGVGDGNIYLLDILRERLEYPDLRRAMLAQAERWQPQAILIEDKASGQSLLQDVRQSTHLPVIACLPDADKLTRFVRVTPTIEAGRFYLPKHAAWLAEFESELLTFPESRHDDQIDALSQALNWLREREWRGNARLRRV